MNKFYKCLWISTLFIFIGFSLSAQSVNYSLSKFGGGNPSSFVRNSDEDQYSSEIANTNEGGATSKASSNAALKTALIIGGVVLTTVLVVGGIVWVVENGEACANSCSDECSQTCSDSCSQMCSDMDCDKACGDAFSSACSDSTDALCADACSDVDLGSACETTFTSFAANAFSAQSLTNFASVVLTPFKMPVFIP